MIQYEESRVFTMVFEAVQKWLYRLTVLFKFQISNSFKFKDDLDTVFDSFLVIKG